MLDARVSDVELGAILIAYRLKGESADELAAMLAAAQASFEPVHVQDAAFRPVSIPSYNGARKQPNLVPLLALLLAREGVPVLVHGVEQDPGRVTSAEIFSALSLAPSASHDAIEDMLAERRVAFASIEVLAPRIARLLSMRSVLGVRNSTHTLVKILQPFAPAGLRLVNYTHPPYRDSLAQLFRDHPDAALGGALLARGTEGEAVADTRRQVQVDWLHDGVCDTLIEAERSSTDAPLSPARIARRGHDGRVDRRRIARRSAGARHGRPAGRDDRADRPHRTLKARSRTGPACRAFDTRAHPGIELPSCVPFRTPSGLPPAA